MRHIYLLVVLMALSVACTSSDEAAEDVPASVCRVNMTVCLQPDMDMTTRALGDPGTYEHFGRPRYFYIFAVGFTDAEGAYPESSGGCVIPMQDGGGNDVNRVDVGEGESAWSKYLMTVDPPQTLNDSVYGSNLSVAFKLPSLGITKMRFYVAASPTELQDDGVKLGIPSGRVLGLANKESDVLALKFDVDAGLRSRLHDLYASPYNYAPGGIYNNVYYYTIDDPSKPVEITRIIYHVAAKVDVKWNVAEDKQDELCISYIEAQRLKQQDCLLFRPTENVWTAVDESANYSLGLMEDDIGLQWYGRHYFYTIPFRKDDNGNGVLEASEKYFDVNLHLLKNGDSKATYAATGYNLRLRSDVSLAAYGIFVPWLRHDLHFTQGVSSMNYTDVTPVDVERIIE